MTNHNSAGALLDAAQAHALGLAMYNAVNAQQQGAIVRQASATMVCAAMLSLGVAETAEAPPQPQPPAGDAAESQPASASAATVAEAIAKVTPALAVDPADLRGKAYQSVALSTAIAIQDAADYLRNMATIATTATGVATAQFLANPGSTEDYVAAMMATQQLMAAAVANFEAVGASAEQILKNFPNA
ncbi:MAG: RebB family R body protein [Sphingomonas sp.]